MLCFDIETDGFLEHMTKIHCINVIDQETREEYRYTDHEFYQDLYGNPTDIRCPRNGTLLEGVELLLESALGGHNILGFDLPAIVKIFPAAAKLLKSTHYDSLVASKLLYPDLKDRDFTALRKGKLPKGFKVGSHALGAWGSRLDGEAKSDFKPENYTNPHTGDPHTWATIPFTQDMDEYCIQDVRANLNLIEHFQTKDVDDLALDIEFETQRIISWQERVGVPFDEEAALKLASDLYARKLELEAECAEAFPPFYLKDKEFRPKSDNARYGYTAGAPLTKIKLTLFNPSSRQHIWVCLGRKYGWEASEFTNTGQPKIDEDVLASLPYPEAQKIAEYMMVQKRLSQLAEGDNAWLKNLRNGRIYGRVDTLGAVTRRMTHFKPNLAQVPANHAPYGERCRALFIHEPDRVIVGCDADALELRVLAHFLARFDGGAYVETVLNGRKEDGTDMHSRNRDAIGLVKRDTAKTWFYAFIYGAGNYKLGTIVMSEWDEAKLMRFYAKFPAGDKRQKKIVAIGKKSRDKLLSGLPAFGKLVDAVQNAAKRGYLKSLDGSRLPVRAMHSALNTLCQSAGAVIMKKALIIMFEEFERQDYDVRPLLNVHDEVQLSTPKEIAEDVGRIAADSITKAGEFFNFRCPLAGDYDIGLNWSQTH